MEIPAAVERSRQAQQFLRERPLRERLDWIKAIRYALVDQRHDLTAAIRADISREPGEVLTTDFIPSTSACRFLEQHAARILRPRSVRWRPFWLIGSRDTVHRQPRGVVGLIGTWNYPLFLNLVPIAHAIAAGNSIVWKPSEQTPHFAHRLSQLLEPLLPKDAVITLSADRQIGEQLLEAEIDYVHFTGSEAVGRSIAVRLAPRFIPSALELSGCDAMIVLPDADITLAARSAMYGIVLNAGQTCLAVRRVFLPRNRSAEFLTIFKELIAGAKPVRLQMTGQVRHYEEIVQSAREAGCEVFRNGSKDGIPPTVIVGDNATSLLGSAACFAPVLGVTEYETLDQALALHRQSRFGLAASIFTQDLTAAARIARQLKVGQVIINDVIVSTAHPGTPFGGRGVSGWGITQGEEGLLEMTLPQVLTVRRGRFRPHVDGTLSADPASADISEGLLRWGNSRGWGESFRGLGQLLGGLRRFGKKQL
jgi:aldehyde dehydrogenase (NAD+)